MNEEEIVAILSQLNSLEQNQIKKALDKIKDHMYADRGILDFHPPFWKQAIIRLAGIAKSSSFRQDIRSQCLDLAIESWNEERSDWERHTAGGGKRPKGEGDDSCKIAFTEALIVILKEKKSAEIKKEETEIVVLIEELAMHQFDPDLGKLVSPTAVLGEDAQVKVLEYLAADTSSTSKEYFEKILQSPNYGPLVYLIAAKALKERFSDKPEPRLYQKLLPLWNRFLPNQDYVRLEQCAKGFGDFPPPDGATGKQLLGQLLPLEKKLRNIIHPQQIQTSRQQRIQAIATLLQVYFAIDTILYAHSSVLDDDNCLKTFRQLDFGNLIMLWEKGWADAAIVTKAMDRDNGFAYLAEIFTLIQSVSKSKEKQGISNQPSPVTINQLALGSKEKQGISNRPSPVTINLNTITNYLMAIEKHLPKDTNQFNYGLTFPADQMAVGALGILFLVGRIRQNPEQKLNRLPLLQNLIAYLKNTRCQVGDRFYAYAFAFTSLAVSQLETLFPKDSLKIPEMHNDLQNGLYKAIGHSGFGNYENLLVHQLAVTTIALLYIKQPINSQTHGETIRNALNLLANAVKPNQKSEIAYVSGREPESSVASVGRAVLVHLAFWLASPKDEILAANLANALVYYANTVYPLEIAVTKFKVTHAGISQISSYYYYTSVPYAVSGIKLLLKHSTPSLFNKHKLSEATNRIYASLLCLTTPGIDVGKATCLPFVGEARLPKDSLVFSNLMAGISLLALQDVLLLCPEPL